jgi:hypothetical protein
MVNISKIRLMTKCAIYEKNGGEEDIEMSGYYKSDYMRLAISKAVVRTTVGFCFIFFLYLLFNLNYFLEIAFNINYRELAYELLAIYLLLIALSVSISCLSSSKKYKDGRLRIKNYYDTLTKINRLNEQDETIKDLEV